MELWFQRGVKLDPDDFSLYMAKRWYLLPRWYGTDLDVWNFGLECAASDNWSAKIPMILIEGIDDAGGRDPSIYARPDIWPPVEKVFRAYLDHYPNSVSYRSRFIKCAADGSHWDVAAEQLKILGNEWDREVFKDNEYPQIQKLVAQHVGSDK
jgi:hypothetical protein